MKTIKLSILVMLLFAISVSFSRKRTGTEQKYTAFTGATIIDGSGSEPIKNGTLLISNERITAIGARDQIKIPENTEIINLAGKTIIPGLINAHGHVGQTKGIEGGHYSRENVEDNLAIYARYGITTVMSLGDDKQESVPLRNAKNVSDHPFARLYIAGEIANGNTPAQAAATVDANHKMGVDIIKIRVDDNLGASKKMPEEIYSAIIKRAHELGYQAAVHMYYLADAKKLLQAGTDFLAHSIRDKPADAELITILKTKKACYCPTLTRELSAFVYGDTAAFFSDPFFLKEYSREVIWPLLNPESQQRVRNSKSAQIYKEQLPVAMANLKTLSDNGVPIAMGTDSGVPTRFMGYFEHLEMEMMAEAGLSPMKIIVSATKDAASCLRLKDLGLLKTGYLADFIVLDKDPLVDIKNTKSISQVWINGKRIN